MDYETMCLNATDPEREQNIIRRRMAEKERVELMPFKAPFTIHPVNDMVVDANGKSVILCLTNAYGRDEANDFAERLVVMLNGVVKHA